MPLDAEARREISRRNGRQSAGPKTKEGKARSRRNALTHGLRAEVLALPHEDPAAIAARADAWFDYYRPEGPAAHHLVNQCVQATILADRCQRHHTAALARQVRAADSDWLIEQEDALERLKRLIPDDPGAALLGLKRLGIGCRWLIERWERLRARLDEDHAWFTDDCDEAIRLLGHRTGVEELRHCPDGFRVRLYNALCLPVPDERVLEWLCHPARLPESLQAQYSIDFLPDPEHCPGLLRAMIDDQIAWLRARAEWLETTIEGPDRAEAPLRAAVLNDPGASRLFVRYHAESRAAFHRAFKELTRVLDDDADAAREDETEDLPAPEVEPEPISPNEPEMAPRVFPNESSCPSLEAPHPLKMGAGKPVVGQASRLSLNLDRRDACPTEHEDEESSPSDQNPGVGGFFPDQPEMAPRVSPNEPDMAAPGGPSWLAARMLVLVLLAVLGLVLAGGNSPKAYGSKDSSAEDRPSPACHDVPAKADFPSFPGVSGRQGALPRDPGRRLSGRSFGAGAQSLRAARERLRWGDGGTRRFPSPNSMPDEVSACATPLALR